MNLKLTSWKFLTSLLLVLLISLTFAFAIKNVSAASFYLYFSGSRSFGQLAVSGETNLEGGKTETSGCFGALHGHNKTRITPWTYYEAIGGCVVELSHPQQFNKKNECFWGAAYYISGSLDLDCYFKD